MITSWEACAACGATTCHDDGVCIRDPRHPRFDVRLAPSLRGSTETVSKQHGKRTRDERRGIMFEVTYVVETITDESAREGDVASSDVSEPETVDVRGFVDALGSQCWDSVDDRGDGTVILYPADSHQDMWTGDYESTQVILKGDPWKVSRVMRYWRALLASQGGRLPYFQ